MNPTGDVLIEGKRETPVEAEVSHGVHLRCQSEQQMVIALCGQQLDRDDEEQPGVRNVCVVCMDLLRCPVCGKQVFA